MEILASSSTYAVIQKASKSKEYPGQSDHTDTEDEVDAPWLHAHRLQEPTTSVVNTRQAIDALHIINTSHSPLHQGGPKLLYDHIQTIILLHKQYISETKSAIS